METQFTRTENLIGTNKVLELSKKHVAIFGLGGVGGYAAESLVRAGIGAIDLIDNDVINITNINRQLIALHSTIGKSKVEVLKKRLLDINPNLKIKTHQIFFSKENSSMFDFAKYDYIIDAIDSVGSKLELILKAKTENCPIISSMGTGNKLNPEMFEISDIYKTTVCPLARVVRTELKKRGIKSLKVVYSKEIPIKNPGNNQRIPASISFVPPVAGLILASQVVKDLI